MNAVDFVQLNLFLAELAHARVMEKDRHVDEAIREMFVRQPDAAYLLVQRVMQLENALCATCAGRTDAAPAARVPSVVGRSADHAAPRQSQAPWWLQPAATFAGTAFLARSAEYLLGPSWY
jgi:uncharacterized protein